MTTPNQKIEPISVLIADDEDAFRLVIREILVDDGFKVEAVDSGETAITAMQRQVFDVVVLDYKMPGVSGLNVLQWMVEQKLDTPVIMLTAAGSEHVAVEAMKYGAYDYLRKEHIDINHLGVIIKGVRERYLFRKEKERRETVERERAISLVAIEIFHNTLASLSQIVDTSLDKASSALDQTERALAPFVRNEGRTLFFNAFQQMKQEYGAISMATKSILRAANLLHGNFTDSKYATDFKETMSAKLPVNGPGEVAVSQNAKQASSEPNR